MVNLGDIFPDFTADSTEGTIKFHDKIANSWAILFSHPADFTPVCTTELANVHKLKPEFEKRGVKLFALSCNDTASHNAWTKDVLSYSKKVLDGSEETTLSFPIIADPDRTLAVKFGMVDPDEKDAAGLPLTCRAVFIIGKDQKLKASLLYPATTGRSFPEILRVVDSLQLTATKKVATPANWNVGDEVMVVPSLSKEQAQTEFPQHRLIEVPSKKEYIRLTVTKDM
ncbi:peroxiredoxin-6-like [Mizuhopecten yessoensis]|uniref:Peroxiredoxin-6 n=1 Tax=Mizuhopecten yessoensis TaxID=6573 RepID=A0A210R145_MIZYE|nr:peroxiredoxin-6-like [Mizuhopecten yessoensis]OWF54687.1 Peroxiredoxin-6 [Mizuhopecten yessoensis]